MQYKVNSANLVPKNDWGVGRMFCPAPASNLLILAHKKNYYNEKNNPVYCGCTG